MPFAFQSLLLILGLCGQIYFLSAVFLRRASVVAETPSVRIKPWIFALAGAACLLLLALLRQDLLLLFGQLAALVLYLIHTPKRRDHA